MSLETRSGTDTGTHGDSLRGQGDSASIEARPVPVSPRPPAQPDPGSDRRESGHPQSVGLADGNDSRGMHDEDAASTAAVTEMRGRSTTAPRATTARVDARIPPAGRKAATLLASGMPVERVADACDVAPSTIWRWRTETAWWLRLFRRAQATSAAETEAELAAGRLEAVRALREIVAPADGGAPKVDAAELSSAARALLAASAPPGELTRQRARAEILRALPSQLRRAVVDALDDEGAHLASLTDEELDALEREVSR